MKIMRQAFFRFVLLICGFAELKTQFDDMVVEAILLFGLPVLQRGKRLVILAFHLGDFLAELRHVCPVLLRLFGKRFPVFTRNAQQPFPPRRVLYAIS